MTSKEIFYCNRSYMSISIFFYSLYIVQSAIVDTFEHQLFGIPIPNPTILYSFYILENKLHFSPTLYEKKNL